MRRLLSLAMLTLAAIAFAQDEPRPDATQIQLPEGRELSRLADDATVAMTRPDYPATPGDVYTLSYLTSIERVEIPVLVDADYTVDLGFLGSVDAAGRTYREVREAIAELVVQTYPNSYPQITIRSIGRFELTLSGHVRETGYVRATGLSRLADVVKPAVLPQSSTRRVTIVRDGRARVYDLFAASRLGETDENPYVRPGDEVRVPRADAIVAVRGAVARPGRYELASGDRLQDVLDEYAGGLAATAAPKHIAIDRGDEGRDVSRIAVADPARQALRNGDTITVPLQDDFLPAVTFQGAVLETVPSERAEDADPPTRPAQVAHRFRPGETLGQALRMLGERISPRADLSRAEYFPPDAADPLDVNLQELLFAYDPAADVELAAGARVVIPFGTFEVFVTGEVTRAQHVTVESVTRLSEAIEPLATRYSSTRDVRVTGAGGSGATYDLFLARRHGRRDQDPYLRPGDTVVVSRAERIVTVSGEVRRPGTYELLDGEELETLVQEYADGLTLDADPEAVTIVRTASDAPAGREEIETSLRSSLPPALLDRDRISVASELSRLPFVSVEGAVVPQDVTNGGQVAMLDYSRRLFRIVPGQSLESFVREIESELLGSADLRGAELRSADGSVRPVDLESVLAGADPATAGLEVHGGQTLVVPRTTTRIVVSGAVPRPGTYDYAPDRDADYYVNLAGGYDRTRTWFRTPRVSYSDGDRVSGGEPVPPGATIVVPANNPFYAWQLETVVSMTSAVVSLLVLLLQ